jgi:hypothetical protein
MGFALFLIDGHFHPWLQYNISAGIDNEWPLKLTDLLYSFQKLAGSKFFIDTSIPVCMTVLGLAVFSLNALRQGFKNALGRLSNLEATSLFIFIGCLLPIAFTVYQPERRLLPLLIPMIIITSHLVMSGIGKFGDTFGGMDKPGLLSVLILLLPTLIVAESLLLLASVSLLKIKWSEINSVSSIWFWGLKIMPALIVIIAALLISKSGNRAHWIQRLIFFARYILIIICGGLSAALLGKVMPLWGISPRLNSLHSIPIHGIIVSIFFIGAGILLFFVLRKYGRIIAVLLAVYFTLSGYQISSWLFQHSFTIRDSGAAIAGKTGNGNTIITHYQTPVFNSGSRIICYWPKAGYNVDAFETFDPDYLLIMRRNNWEDIPLGSMSADEWPPPVRGPVSKVGTYELCPVAVRGSRFILELYSLKQPER